jgi:ABC-type antimicrobial peptide transport system permease subunit
MLKQFPEDQPTEKAPADSRGAADSPKNKNVLDDEEVGPNGARTVVRKVVVRGVLKHPEKDADLFSFLQFTGVGSRANVYINHETTESISMRRKGFGGFWTVAGSVDEVADLRGVIDEVEATGLRTRSAVTIVEKLAKEVGKLKLAAGALAMVILFVAAIGICNTMIIAVLERTPEFGIMKSLGAEDRQVLNLVLLEGLLTGLLGAAVAMLVSYGLASGMSEILRGWIEERLKGSFDQPVFRFSVLDAAIVFAITATVCTLASLFPAWRAAKLDPITAMRRT